MIDSALEQSKGYYEMILQEKEHQMALRFNLNAFKNSYLLPDLVKMELTYHAVKVGKIKLENLDVGKEFSFETMNKIPDVYKRALEDIGELTESKEENYIEVYDVILAGVKND